MTDDLTRLRERLVTSVPRDVDLVPQIEAFIAGVDAVLAALVPHSSWIAEDGTSFRTYRTYRIADHEETA